MSAGNVYTAQLSNSSGSFAAPTAIGTLSSTGTGSLTISAILPSGLPAGNGYRIRVDASNPATVGSDNGTNLTVTTVAPVGITSTPANGVICAGNAASLSAAGAGGTTFQWSPSGSLSSPTGSNVMATPTSTQVYTVVGTDANGCSNSATFTVTVESCAGLEEESLGDFQLYPNPVNQELTIEVGDLKGIQTLSILDLAGRTVLTTTESTAIDVSSLESGKYFLLITHEEGNAGKSFLKN